MKVFQDIGSLMMEAKKKKSQVGAFHPSIIMLEEEHARGVMKRNKKILV